jgi:hypothetical protein
MKALSLILLLVISSLGLKSQELRYSDLTPDENGRHQYHGNRIITSYISKGGTVYKIGDKLKIGIPSSNKTFAYITNEYQNFMMESKNGERQLESNASNSEAEIYAISISGSKRTGWFVILLCNGTKGRLRSTYDVQLENAIAAKEVKTDLLSSDEALNELKKCKDKLDLGLITQQKYDSIKGVLIKYIK